MQVRVTVNLLILTCLPGLSVCAAMLSCDLHGFMKKFKCVLFSILIFFKIHVYLFVIICHVYTDALRDQQQMSVSELVIQAIRSSLLSMCTEKETHVLWKSSHCF